jgi:hypothetical protein
MGTSTCSTDSPSAAMPRFPLQDVLHGPSGAGAHSTRYTAEVGSGENVNRPFRSIDSIASSEEYAMEPMNKISNVQIRMWICMAFLVGSPCNVASGISSPYFTCRNRARDNGSCADNGFIPDGHALEDNGVRTDEYVVANGDRFSFYMLGILWCASIVRIERVVVMIVDSDVATQFHMAADSYAGP